MITRAKAGISEKCVFLATKHALPSSSSAYYDTIETSCYSEATKSHVWKKAMATEFSALRQGTWSLVPYSPSMHVVGCRWVYKIKHHPDGSIARHEAQLVAKGFHQAYGVDYTETFSQWLNKQQLELFSL